MFAEYFAFEDSEFARIVNILRGAYQIRTSDGSDDELLGDFIEALETRCPILTTEAAKLVEEQDELHRGAY